jgi:hypothetical protein
MINYMFLSMVLLFIQSISLSAQNSREYRLYHPVELNGAWSNFMNTYAVWIDDAQLAKEGIGYHFTFSFNASNSGIYTFECAADNSGTLIVDGETISDFSSFHSSEKYSIYLKKGKHSGRVNFSNALQGSHEWQYNPAGVALKITDYTGKTIFSTRDQSVIGYKFKDKDTILLQLISFEFGDCSHPIFKEVNGTSEFSEKNFDKKSQNRDIFFEITDLYYNMNQDTDFIHKNMFYIGYIEYRRPDYNRVYYWDCEGCTCQEPLPKNDKRRLWMINSIYRRR